MIKSFTIEDLGAFIPNQYSNPDYVLEVLFSPEYETKTLLGDDGLVKAILCFRNYWGRNWLGFMLIAKDFKPEDALTLKDYIKAMMTERNAMRLQTESVANDTLRSWHRFLGFKHEGVRVKMMFNQDYDCWALLREGE